MTDELLQQALDALNSTNLDLHVRAMDAIRAHLAKPERPINCGTGHCSCIECVVGQETCKWTEDDGEMWETTCGEAWEFPTGGPVENGVKFCHGCGKPVEIGDAT